MATVRERNKSAVAHLTYQDVSAAQQVKIDALRKAAHGFAKVIIKNTESGPESTLAQRHIEDGLNRAIRSVIFELPVADEVPPPVKEKVVKKTVAPATKVVKKSVKRAAKSVSQG